MPNEQRLGHRIEQLEQHFFVGREQEIALFESYIINPSLPHRLINFYGTGGVGKSYLLEELRRRTMQQGALFILIDSRDIVHSAESFSKHLFELLSHACGTIETSFSQDESPTIETYLQNMSVLIEKKRVIIALDTYEEMSSIDYWLRETFMVRMNQQVLFLVSGRLPLQNAWFSSPAWARLILKLELCDLDYASVEQYLHRCSMDDEQQRQIIWYLTKGHPLTLSLLTAIAGSTHPKQLHKVNDVEILPYIIKQWLLEVPGEDLRILVEGSAIARQFNQEFLSFILDKPIAKNEFEQLTRLSFVRRMERGWILHDMVRDAIQRELRTREPERFESIRRYCMMYYYEKIIGEVGRKQTGWETSELFYYLLDTLTRSFIYDELTFVVRFEALRDEEIDEAKEYIAKRRLQPKAASLKIFDPDENRIVDYSLTPEQNLLTLKPLENIDELLRLGPNIVKAARNEQGEIVGLSAVIPIHHKTLPFLQEQPFSRAYFSSLDEDSIASLSVHEHTCAGWYIQTIHVSDFGSAALRNASAYLFFSYLLSGGLLIASPPPLPYLNRIHQRAGVEYIPDLYHYDYGPEYPAKTYMVDTRGEKLAAHLDKLLTRSGVSVRIKPRDAQERKEKIVKLTPREQEIVHLLNEGSTNKEIASKLFISEISVKKHLTTLFRKFGVKNRTQLAQHLNQSSRELE
jgi:DNA-binding CsgD family transcriptional regulator